MVFQCAHKGDEVDRFLTRDLIWILYSPCLNGDAFRELMSRFPVMWWVRQLPISLVSLPPSEVSVVSAFSPDPLPRHLWGERRQSLPAAGCRLPRQPPEPRRAGRGHQRPGCEQFPPPGQQGGWPRCISIYLIKEASLTRLAAGTGGSSACRPSRVQVPHPSSQMTGTGCLWESIFLLQPEAGNSPVELDVLCYSTLLCWHMWPGFGLSDVDGGSNLASVAQSSPWVNGVFFRFLKSWFKITEVLDSSFRREHPVHINLGKIDLGFTQAIKVPLLLYQRDLLHCRWKVGWMLWDTSIIVNSAQERVHLDEPY